MDGFSPRYAEVDLGDRHETALSTTTPTKLVTIAQPTFDAFNLLARRTTIRPNEEKQPAGASRKRAPAAMPAMTAFAAAQAKRYYVFRSKRVCDFCQQRKSLRLRLNP
jgi:hypothetical protein